MVTTAEALDLGWQHHQRGALREAEELYRQVLRVEPWHARALYLTGVVAYQLGEAERALAHLGQAAALEPGSAAVHYHLGLAKRALGRLEEAVASYRQAVALQPNLAEAHNNMGVALHLLGRLEEAAACYRQALSCRPDYAEAHNNLTFLLQSPRPPDAAGSPQVAAADAAAAHFRQGVALQQQGRADQAVPCYEQALRLRPDFAEAHNNLGAALQGQGRWEEAIASFREAVRLKPDYADAHKNLGTALQKRGLLEEAIACYRQATALRPDLAEAHSNHGAALNLLGRYEEAVACFEQALRARPDYAEAHNNLGAVLHALGRRDEAMACFERALRAQPDYAEAHFNRALALLTVGDYERGWPGWEWRWRCKGFPTQPLSGPQPAWDGSPLGGRTILLRAEQGLGDTLHFVRYAPLVKQRGGRVLVECQLPLLPLLTTCPGIDRVFAVGESRPAFDVHALLMSLPGLLGTTVTTIPADVPYLQANPLLVEQWGRELSGAGGLKVGIVWQGSTAHLGDRIRSAPLAAFAPLGRLKGVRLFSLQVGAGHEQLAALGGRFRVTDLGGRFDRASFADAAAVVRNLDLVVTVDTALAHLAGALGAPVWVALPFAAEWRWLLGREDSPWYPTMRLFRQPRPGDWGAVFARMRDALRERLRA